MAQPDPCSFTRRFNMTPMQPEQSQAYPALSVPLNPPRPSEPVAARRQTRISLLLLAAAVVPLLVAQWCVQHDDILLPARLAKWKQTNGYYLDGRFFKRPEDRVLSKVLPEIDPSRGGVYFLGNSRLRSALCLYEGQTPGQAFIHDLSLGGTNYTEQLQYLHMLVEDLGFLRAGGDKYLVVTDLYFGFVSHGNIVSSGHDWRPEWRDFFTQSGLYSADAVWGVHPIVSSSLTREFRRRSFNNDVFWAAINRSPDAESDYLFPSLKPSPDLYRHFWDGYLGPDWKNGMDAELEQFAITIDYLQARHVKLVAVRLPYGSWFKDYEPLARYREHALALMGKKGVPVLDLEDRLTDSSLADSAHYNYAGTHRLHPILMDIAQQQLRAIGLIP